MEIPHDCPPTGISRRDAPSPGEIHLTSSLHLLKLTIYYEMYFRIQNAEYLRIAIIDLIVDDKLIADTTIKSDVSYLL